MPESEDILLIDKPAGKTSFDVIRQLRRKLSVKKIGHAGTLDPLATGLMILGVGPGTKKLADLFKLDKEYIAEVLIGEKRSTGDMEGEILESAVIDEENSALELRLKSVLDSMIGKLSLPVSAYSAIKVDGVPMYKRARKAERSGEVVEPVPDRDMVVYEAELENLTKVGDKYQAKIIFKVGSGTYIRSLAEELGNRLGYPATLASLRRTQVGEYRIEEAKKLEDF